MRGLKIDDMDNMTYGMLINYACAYDRQQQIIAGKEVIDPEQQYLILKENLPVVEERFKLGKIKEKEYRRYIDKIKRYEED